MNMNIRTGRIEELQEIMALIARCVAVMQAGGAINGMISIRTERSLVRICAEERCLR